MHKNSKAHELNEEQLKDVSGGTASAEMDEWIAERLRKAVCPVCQAPVNANSANIHDYEAGKKAVMLITCTRCNYMYREVLTD